MTKASLSFGTIKIEISDERSSVTDVTNIAYSTLSLLIPELRKCFHEEQEHLQKLEAANEECDECSPSKKDEQKKLNELYV